MSKRHVSVARTLHWMLTKTHTTLWCLVAALATACAPAQVPDAVPSDSLPVASATDSEAGYLGPWIPESSGYPMMVEPTSDIEATLTAMSWTPIPTVPQEEPTLAPPKDLPEWVVASSVTDADYAWMLGLTRSGDTGAYQLGMTEDGGGTWHALPLPADPYQTDWWAQEGIFFSDARQGWVYYPGHVLSTSDGGLTWTNDPVPGVIRTISRSIDGTLWAYELRGAEIVVWDVIAPAYPQWRERSAPIALGLSSGVDLMWVDAVHGWLSDWTTADNGNIVPHLQRTSDGGQSWTSQPHPCAGMPVQGSIMIAVTHETFWLMCSDVLTSTEGRKVMYRTVDGGQTWELKGRALLRPDDTLSTGGLLNGFGAASERFAYASFYRTTSLLMTHDGGDQWSTLGLPCPDGYVFVTFVNENVGWVYWGGCVARTLDGGETWQCVAESVSCIKP